MENPIAYPGSIFFPLTDLDNDKTMNWQNNTMRPVDDAKEMKPNHLTDDSTSNTTNDTRPSIKKHASISNNKRIKHAAKFETHVRRPTLHLNKKDKTLYVPLQFDKYDIHALLDTGAIQSSMSEA